jgi:hypothetical protein
MAAPPTQPYYRPYAESDSELSDSDLDSPAFSYSTPPERPPNAGPDLDELPDFAALARGLAAAGGPTNREVALAAGPPFSSTKTQIEYGVNRLTPRSAAYGPFEYKDISGEKIETAVGTNQTVIVLQSRDRDRTIYPDPTICQLNLPRIYKNVTAFSIAQLNLTSAFFYFSPSKFNVTLRILEKDRIVYDLSSNPTRLPNGSNTPLTLTNTIREGSYNISQLLNELNIQLNRVPLFYDWVGGILDFATAFQVNGDFSLNFNYPGDNYYDAMRKVYVSNPTRAQIVAFYFQNQYANKTTYTSGEVRVSYYYPVLKEYILDPTSNFALFNWSYPGYTPEEIRQYLLFNFQGIGDAIALAIIDQNSATLDNYRLLHTFRYSLVNKYLATYDQTNNRVNFQTAGLNSSLANLLNTTYANLLSQLLSKYQLTNAGFAQIYNQNTIILSILQDMYDYLQRRMATFFAINYGTYSRLYYANSSNFVYIQSGLDVSGAVTAGSFNSVVEQQNTNLLENFRTDPPYYWTKLTDLGAVQTPYVNMGKTTDPYPTSSNFPYNVFTSNIDLTQNFISSNGNIYIDRRRRAGDILVDVEETKYTVFRFRSNIRQTLQIETLPRQTAWRYPAWNKSHLIDFKLSNLFDVSYCYITPSNTFLTKVTYGEKYKALPGWSNVLNTNCNYGFTYAQSIANYTSNYKLDVVNTGGNHHLFQTPFPIDPSTRGSNVYTYDMRVTFYAPGGFPTDCIAYFYHDIAAFSADISGVRHEYPIHYKNAVELKQGTYSNNLNFLAYANQEYYIIVRTISITSIYTEYKIIPWFPSGTACNVLSYNTEFNTLADPSTMLSNYNVAIQADPALIRMPIGSNLWGSNPSDNILNSNITPNINPIGYDSNGVSSDLTDYIPFRPNNPVSNIYPGLNTRFDPTNNYIFQSNSPYSIPAQSYFYREGSSALLKPFGVGTYTWGGIAKRQYKLVQYYSTHFLSNYNTSRSFAPERDTSPFCKPMGVETTSNTAIYGYEYINNNLILDKGVCGFTFLPSDGLWTIDRVMFKTSFTNLDVSPNQNIHAVCVFLATDISKVGSALIPIQKALAICLRTNVTLYSSNTDLNLGTDAGLGSYYTFSNYPQLVTRSNVALSGFTQNNKTLLDDITAYYSVVAFNFPTYTTWDINTINLDELKAQFESAKAITIENLTGTPIAYPYANTPYTSLRFYDGTEAPSGKGMVLSTSNGNSTLFGPIPPNDESVVQYEQSIAYVNTQIHYFTQPNIALDASGFKPWTSNSIYATYVHGSIPNYLMQQGDIFVIDYYKTFLEADRTTPPERYFQQRATLTADQIFSDYENTNLIGVSGNSRHYCFLGASNLGVNCNVSQLRFKLYDPVTGILTELPINSNYRFAHSNLLQHFVFHNTRRWFITSYSSKSNVVTLQGDNEYQEVTGNTVSYFTRNYSNYTTSELQMDPSGSYVYLSLYNGSTGFSNINIFSFDPEDSNVYVGSSSRGILMNLINQPGLPSNYLQMAVTKNDKVEEILLLNQNASPFRFMKVRNYLTNSNTPNTLDGYIQISEQIFNNIAGTGIIPTRIYGGGNGSKWLTFQPSSAVSSNLVIWGNRNDAVDAPKSIDSAWQVFFPTMKIEMKKAGISSTAITDLTGITYPEYPHTVMHVYSNYQGLFRDLSNNGGQWGLESKSNYYVNDISFNGFYFNAYCMSVPLYSNANPSYLNDYYLAIRGWLPTERFQTMLRFYLPNRYDYGYLKLLDLSNEVLIACNSPQLFNPSYFKTLQGFNQEFTFSNRVFGINVVQGYGGSNISSCNFGDYLTQYNGYYNMFLSNSDLLNKIQTELAQQMNEFIAYNLKYILPSSALTRQRFTDPLTFQMQWRSELTPNYIGLDDEWGLGWNLGFAKADTGFSTIHIADSFYKIQQDFIYLRLNPEFNVNRMDAGGKENYATTREATGTTNQYYLKLLLTSFGGNATTFIHNPITFNPPLNRLTKLSFSWIDARGVPIVNHDSEWDMTVNITEKAETASIPFKMPAWIPPPPPKGEGLLDQEAPPEEIDAANEKAGAK